VHASHPPHSSRLPPKKHKNPHPREKDYVKQLNEEKQRLRDKWLATTKQADYKPIEPPKVELVPEKKSWVRDVLGDGGGVPIFFFF